LLIAPTVDDFAATIRRGSWDDFDAVYALIATPSSKPEFLRSRWNVPSFEPERHLWLAVNGGLAVAFGALYMPDDAVVRGDPAQIPALLERIEEQARTEDVPQLAFILPDTDEPAVRAYRDYGFEVATNVLQMEVDLTEPPPPALFPAGVGVRTYTAEDARAVQELLDAAYSAWDDAYVPMAHEDWLAFMTEHASFDPTCWWLAEADGELAGVCLTWREGWIKDIATTQSWRGRGLGKALLLHALAEHRARGNPKVGLKVDDRNPTGAIQLYERCGFRVDRRFQALVKRL
jgi:ribosomal protein S18 acetylase RimI-like enzyme